MNTIVAYCRAGFEPEAAEDVRRIAGDATSFDDPALRDRGYVVASAARSLEAIDREMNRAEPVFVRTLFGGQGSIPTAPFAVSGHHASRIDRVSPLLEAIDALAANRLHAPPWQSAWIEHADTNEGRQLSPLARALGSRIEGALRGRAALVPDAPRRLHVFLVDGTTAYVGTTPASRVEWPQGVPRLRMPGRAPSRSTLKLAEAVVWFLGEAAGELLRPGMRAVDLGAAPGGWTWQLVQRGLRVTAVDNGALKGEIARDPLVTHVRADGLTWRPRRPVDWMVCDIVLAPSRIAELVARWVASGDARRSIFNLKLPMKKRYDAIDDARERIEATVRRAGVRCTLRLRQLYHDREEVTGYLARTV